MKQIKERLIKEFKTKYDLDEVTMASIVDRCVEEGFKLGQDNNETEKWKSMAERSTQLFEKTRKEYDTFRSLVIGKFKEFNESFNKFKGAMPNG